MHSLLSVHGCSLFSDELLNRLAEPLMNVNIELLHSQIIVAKNMFQNPNSTLEINCLQCTDLLVGFVQIGLDNARRPIASVSAESSFSAKRRIKTQRVIFGHPRPKREQEWSLIYVERELSESMMNSLS